MANRKNCSLRSVFLRYVSPNISKKQDLEYGNISAVKFIKTCFFAAVFASHQMKPWYTEYVCFRTQGTLQNGHSLFFSAARSLRRFSQAKSRANSVVWFQYACDSSRIRANRTLLIAKTARCARSFCDMSAPIFPKNKIWLRQYRHGKIYKNLLFAVVFASQAKRRQSKSQYAEKVCRRTQGTCTAIFFSATRSLRRFSQAKSRANSVVWFQYACDSSRIRANRTLLIAKTARCARSFWIFNSPIMYAKCRIC